MCIIERNSKRSECVAFNALFRFLKISAIRQGMPDIKHKGFLCLLQNGQKGKRQAMTWTVIQVIFEIFIMETIMLISKIVVAAKQERLEFSLSSIVFGISLVTCHIRNTIPGSAIKAMSSFAFQSQR
uniref:Uncharacterized protein n=1 Tax=Glossina austeni TaxID=7395 RepID=A0A1A9VYV5_GLOAU